MGRSQLAVLAGTAAAELRLFARFDAAALLSGEEQLALALAVRYTAQLAALCERDPAAPQPSLAELTRGAAK